MPSRFSKEHIAPLPVMSRLDPSYDKPTDEDPSDLRAFCESIVREMAIRPSDLVLSWGQRGTLLELTISPSDGTSKRQLGPLIGRDGVTIEALRRILQVISMRRGYCVHIKIYDRVLSATTPEDSNAK